MEPGTPTLTIESTEKQVMIPWITFHHAIWQGQKIEVHFSAWRVEVLGNDLDDLWKALQQQNILTMRKSRRTSVSGCFVRTLAVIKVGKEDAGEIEDERATYQLSPF